MPNTVKNAQDELNLLTNEVDTLRARTLLLPPGDMRTQLILSLDTWKRDVAGLAQGTSQFWNTISFTDRVIAMQGLHDMLAQQAINEAQNPGL